MKRLLLGAVLLSSLTTVSAQDTSIDKPVKNVSLEIFGGSNGFGAVYDSRFKENSGWGYGIGAAWGFSYSNGSLFASNSHSNTYSISPRINYLIGKKNRKLELQFGTSLGYEFYNYEFDSYNYNQANDSYDVEHIKNKGNSFMYYLYGGIGYRRQAPKGFVFRVGLTPIFGFGDKHTVDKVYVCPYIGAGWSF